MTDLDPQLRACLLTISKLLANTTQRTRALWGMSVTTAIVDKADPVVKSLEAEAKLFANQVAELRAKIAAGDADNPQALEAKTALQQLGPPAPTMMIAMMQTLRDAVAARVQRAEQEPPDYVKYCRLEGCHDEAKAKISYATTDPELDKVIGNLLPGKVMLGQPPPGWLEDDLSAWIESLEIK